LALFGDDTSGGGRVMSDVDQDTVDLSAEYEPTASAFWRFLSVYVGREPFFEFTTATVVS